MNISLFLYRQTDGLVSLKFSLWDIIWLRLGHEQLITSIVLCGMWLHIHAIIYM